MDLLDAKTRDYDWGTSDAIAELQGRPVPAPGPEAELWMGAHPTAPSGVRDTTLDALIEAAPVPELGAEVAARFGGRLPFLLKVLSAARALSIQVHPSRAQAEAGYADEEERKVPRDAPDRNYVDDWPKPELLYALTPFEVAAGRRPARLPARHRHRAARQLRQRGPFGPDRQAHRRPRTAQAPRPRRRGAHPRPPRPARRDHLLRHPGPGVPPPRDRAHRTRTRPPRHSPCACPARRRPPHPALPRRLLHPARRHRPEARPDP